MSTAAAASSSPPPASSRVVSSLLGHAQVEMALTCLGSLLASSAEPLRLRLHGDGSLTVEDRRRLTAGLTGAAGAEPEIIPRSAAEERVAALLTGRPRLAALRRENPLFLKLLDVVAFADGGELAFCDADILFLRPFRRLFHFPAPAAGAVFMSDVQSAYSLRSWHLLAEGRLRLPRRVNSGLIHFRTERLDLDLAEWLVSEERYRFVPAWLEQTCWALLGERAGCWLLDPRQVAIPTADADPEAPVDAVALHFVSPVRHLLAPFAAHGAVAGGAPVTLTRRPARRCRAHHLALCELRRRLGRLRPAG